MTLFNVLWYFDIPFSRHYFWLGLGQWFFSEPQMIFSVLLSTFCSAKSMLYICIPKRWAGVVVEKRHKKNSLTFIYIIQWGLTHIIQKILLYISSRSANFPLPFFSCFPGRLPRPTPTHRPRPHRTHGSGLDRNGSRLPSQRQTKLPQRRSTESPVGPPALAIRGYLRRC